MRWKKTPNFIIAVILSFAFVIVTFLDIIGPLHANETGEINSLTMYVFYDLIYLILMLTIMWGAYFILYKKPKTLFFVLMIFGVFTIVLGSFLW